MGCNLLNQPRCVYHRALIRYPTRFMSRRLLKTTALILIEDQEGSTDVEGQTTDGKAEVCIIDED